MLRRAADLLGADEPALKEALLYSIQVTRGETINMQQNPVQAGAARNALVRALYSNLFNWVVESVNSAMDKAEVVVGADARNKAWANIDRQITALAPAVPWIWDDTANIRSTDVAGVINKFNSNWDLSFTSLK
jgi:ABC-type transport system substrate-binding protein